MKNKYNVYYWIRGDLKIKKAVIKATSKFEAKSLLKKTFSNIKQENIVIINVLRVF